MKKEDLKKLSLKLEFSILTSPAKMALRKRRRLRYLKLTILFLIVFSAIFYYSTYIPDNLKLERQREKLMNTISPIKEEVQGKLACELPKLNPFDPSILNFIEAPPEIDCGENTPLTFGTNYDSTLIKLKDHTKDLTCCYRTLWRGNFSDTDVRYSKECYIIKNRETKLKKSDEFIAIRCMNNTHTFTTDMFAFIPFKKQVEIRIQNYEAQRENYFRIHFHTKEPLEDIRPSIIILGLDAQSHMNFQRQMPLTFNFLRNDLSAISLNGYNKVADNTFPNVVPILTGLNVDELKRLCWHSKESSFDTCPFIWNYFASNGYRTSFAEDSVWMGAFNYEKRGFYAQPTDYYLNPFTWQMAKKIGHTTMGNARVCYGPRLGFQVLLDYIVKTAVRFSPLNQKIRNGRKEQTNLYFQFVWANSLFHDFLNNPKLGDESLYSSLKFLQENGHLNKSVLILLSDHGIRWGPIRSSKQGQIEERMPFSYLVFPQWFMTKFPKAFKNLRLNSDRLTTPFDIHETLIDLVKLGQVGNQKYFGESGKYRRGISLFSRVPKERTCSSAGIEQHWCTCNMMNPIGNESKIAVEAANFVLKSINELLEDFPQCAKLVLKQIKRAEMKGNKTNVDSNILDEKNENDVEVQINLAVTPSLGEFEATIERTGKDWKLMGEISRTNLYANQSKCIHDFELKKFCFCLSQHSNY